MRWIRLALAASLVTTGAVTLDSSAATAVDAHGSARQVYATGLPGGSRASLLDSRGQVLQSQVATPQGGVLFRDVKAGAGYRVRTARGTSGALVVHSEQPATWNPKAYEQKIADHGYQYLTTRDGTQLSLKVWPPTTPAGEGTPDVNVPAGPDFAEPYPTLVEYSGYGYANPDGPENGIAILANAMGFAVVDVNMRGTGCSGGAFSFFEPLQSLDGYDVIETIARQPWVRGHKVGMMGISYGGISQLFTAALRPPSLAAISPLSVIDATATTLYPGGVLNTGFAVAWALERQEQAKPAGPHGGQAWAYKRIQGGDTTCARNQALHGKAQDLPATIAANSHYNPAYADSLDPLTFVHKINVPVFLACQFEDEQTGGHCPTLASRFTGTKKKWFTFTNGAHIDSLDPETYNRWYDFLQLYVAQQAPAVNAAATHAAAPVVYNQAMGLPSSDVVNLPPDPVQLEPTYDTALAAFEKLPSVRVLFDNGAGPGPTGTASPGDPYPGFEASFPSFPAPGTTARTWYVGPGGALTDRRVGKGIDVYTSNARALPKNDFGSNTGGGGLWGNASQWSWSWKQNPPGTSVSYVTAPLAADTTVLGAGAVNLWVRSSTPDVDLMATVSEVSADGHETFVQNGWIRASERKLSTSPNSIFKHASTALEPVPSMLASDVRPMPKDQFVPVTIPLYYEGHAYRKGTRIRVTIAAPNGTQPIWAFDHTQPASTASVSIAYSAAMPSSVVLPVVPGVAVTSPQPACPSLRNEPCRAYVATRNRSASR